MSEDYTKHIETGNSAWLEEVMATYGRDVWNFAYFATKNRAMADDIAQETFIQAYRNVHSFRGQSSVKTWLLKITKNISINHRNSAFFRKALLMDLLIPPKGSGLSAEQEFMEREVTSELWAFVLRLPAKCREVLLLQAKHEMPLHEIAHILGIPVGTVKSRLSTARKKLSKMLEEDAAYELI
ncbi:RNA polymerase sigma factor [Cohnella sp. GCM10027633]|uniref:RNA polymerase sigma factor n=1 Tax=unclassified Cohnella TaxID=2636738 RepID=UPI0036254109